MIYFYIHEDWVSRGYIDLLVESDFCDPERIACSEQLYAQMLGWA